MLVQRNLLRLVRPVRGLVAASVGLALLITGARVAQALLLAHVVLGVAVEGDDLASLAGPLWWLAAVIAARATLVWLAEALAARTAHATKKHVRDRVYARLMELGPGYAALHRSGTVRAAVVDAVESLEVYNARYLPALLHALTAPLAVLAFLLAEAPWLALIGLAGAAFSVVAPALFMRWYSDRSDRVWAEIGAFDAEFTDTVQGLPTLKAFGASARRRAFLADLAERVRRVSMGELRIGLLNASLQRLGTLGAASAVLIAAAVSVTDGGVAPFAAVLVIFLTGEVFRPLDDLGALVHEAMGGVGAATRVAGILDAEDPTPAPRDPRPAGRLAPTVAFEGVTLTYPGRDDPALREVSFTAGAAARLAVVGPSGSGKTTLVSLMLRFLDPEAGTVRVGGRDVRELDPDELRAMFAVVSQDTYLFHGTIGENIALGRPGASREQVRQAARAAGVAAFIEELPHGYDTPVGERGLQLSGGQRQRIAIARAVLKDAPVLVLDEATSAVDAAGEAAIQQALDAVSRGRTTITIAHRLSTVRDADEILVLAGGRIADRGTHEALRQRQGLYAELIAAQR
ncbi:ABC transporter ATP-binding protein/permease [Streptomyces sp. 6N223]|uniref:ABC transporter ATP-binding protein/permease n=1 Tax=Streptomyces sp. 6N223 TaxID=3457412 RepID=UPI003FD42430